MPKRESKSFEEAMAKLEAIVDQLEKGGLELDESLKLFEDGTALFASCKRMLDSAQTRMDVLFEEAGQWESRSLTIEGDQQAAGGENDDGSTFSETWDGGDI